MIRLESAGLKQNGKVIFSTLNLQIEEKEKVLIRGRSGTGKTTLFKTFLGFATLESGRVLFNEQPITKENIRDVRSRIFYLSQDVDLKNETVRVLLDEIKNSFGADNDNFKPGHIENLFAFFDLDTVILNQHVKELSGGERQRLGLIIGCLLDRPVWLLDEPTSALDDSLKEKISEFILKQDKTIVVISHDDTWEKHPDIRIERWS